MSRLEKYPKYKDSGVEWIGEVPEEWKITKLGLCLTPVSIKNKSDLPLLSVVREKGIILRDIENQESNHNFIPDDLSNYKMVEKGQFTMNKMKAWQGSYGVSSYTGIVSPAYYVFKLQHVKPDFFHLAIRSKSTYVPFFVQASDGVRIGQWDLSKTRMKEIPFYLPSEEEQDKIVKYIRENTKKIDKAITLKVQLIEKLNERRQVLINDAVTKGLDKNIKMKESGLEWIGEFPEGWDVKKLKYFVDIKGGFAFDSSAFNDEGIQIIKIANTYMNKLSLDRQPTFVKDIYLDSHSDWVVSKGDILMSLTGTMGKRDYGFAILLQDKKKYLLNQRVAKLNIKNNMSSDYLLTILHSNLYLNQLYSLPSGTKQANLSNDNVINIVMPIPPITEREKIATFIKLGNDKIDKVISLQHKQIEKLKEYKTTLIDSLVTGKIKIP